METQTILVAMSPSAQSQEALFAGLALARQCGGRLVLMQAVELNICGEERGIARSELIHGLMLAAESRLKNLARAMGKGVRCATVVLEGPAGDAILRAARKFDADAIVMGPRRAGLLAWLRRNHVRTVLEGAESAVYLTAGRAAQDLQVGHDAGQLVEQDPVFLD